MHKLPTEVGVTRTVTPVLTGSVELFLPTEVGVTAIVTPVLTGSFF